MIVYNTPDEVGNNVVIRVTEDEAISLQKKAADRKGFIYDSDLDALEDFLTVHWAWREP